MEAVELEALKAKHLGAELIELKSKSATVIAKVTKAEVDLFRELSTSPATKSKAMERFVRACIVSPSPDEVVAILFKKPGLAEKWGDELLDEAGAGEEVERKKL
jgi:hypothetical protein